MRPHYRFTTEFHWILTTLASISCCILQHTKIVAHRGLTVLFITEEFADNPVQYTVDVICKRNEDKACKSKEKRKAILSPLHHPEGIHISPLPNELP